MANYVLCVDSNGNICVDGDGNACIYAIQCNSCDPPLEYEYSIVISGLAGDFADANGTWIVRYDVAAGGCSWADVDGPDGLTISMTYGAPWGIDIYATLGTCQITLTQDTSGGTCDPTGAYSVATCDDSTCDDSDSCTDSSGATATVSVP